MWSKDFLLHWNYLHKTLQILTYVFDCLYYTPCLTPFFLYQLPSSSLCTVFDSISSNIDGVLLIDRSANVFIFWYFNVHHKYSMVELIDMVNSVIIFLSPGTLFGCLPFLLASLTVTLTFLPFWIFYFFWRYYLL